MTHLHRYAKKKREQVHDREAWEQLSLQEHGGMVQVAVLSRGVVLVGSVHLMVHDDHVYHHAHHWHTKYQAHQERFPPPRRAKTFEGTQRNVCLIVDIFSIFKMFTLESKVDISKMTILFGPRQHDVFNQNSYIVKSRE